MGWKRLLGFLRMSPATGSILMAGAIAALLCGGLKHQQVVTVGGFYPNLWKIIVPELSSVLIVVAVSLLLLTWLPRRLTGVVLGLFCAILFVYMAIISLDTLSMQIRLALLHPAEVLTFFRDPTEIWPVVSSALSSSDVIIGFLVMGAMLGLCGGLWWYGMRPDSTPRGTARDRLLRAALCVLLIGCGLTGFFERQSVRVLHKAVQVPLVERFMRGIRISFQASASIHVPAPVPLQIDRAAALPPFNIIFIVLESTNWFGTSLASTPSSPAQPTTPLLQELAKQGLEARTTYAAGMHTSKSLVSLLCGHPPYPYVRNRIEFSYVLNPCLPEVLAGGGYQTGYFQAPTLTFEQREALVRKMGYQEVDGGEKLEGTGFEVVNYYGREDRIILEPALAWVKQTTGPYMLTVMTGTTHHPYGSPGHPAPEGNFDLTKGARERFLHALRYVDAFSRDLIEGIRAARGLENTLIVIVGDHGEGFGEHQLFGHDWIPYEEGARVPLVLWGPDVLKDARGVTVPAGGTIDGLRSQVDLFPTVLGLLGWKWKEGALMGKSLFDPVAHPMVWTACMSADRCMVAWDERYKYIRFDHLESLLVFDLLQDPGEQHDLSATIPAEQLRNVEAFLWRNEMQTAARYHSLARGDGRLISPMGSSEK